MSEIDNSEETETTDTVVETEAAAEIQPARMSGFTILQIISRTNAEIVKCREKLEVEPSGRVVAFLQGKIPGCKFAVKTIREIFGFTDEQLVGLEAPVEMTQLTQEQILGAEIDMNELKESELWGLFINAIEGKAEELKEYLLKSAKKSRELDESQGEYQGMSTYEKVFNAIADQVSFWKNSLFKKRDAGGDESMRDANDNQLALPAPAIEESDEPEGEYDDDDDREDVDLDMDTASA